MANFRRGFGKEELERLAAAPLFRDRLREDIERGDVFFALRPGYGSFYHKGCALFSYDKGGFSSHQRFAFVPSRDAGSYIYENQLDAVFPVRSFSEGYDQIKKNAARYARGEAEGISALYAYAPTTKNIDAQYFLVDIEIVLGGEKKGDEDVEAVGNLDRIDMLLYDNEARKLLFCEAKLFSNKELWTWEGDRPKVNGQLSKYNEQLQRITKENILAQYSNAFVQYNALLDTALKPPVDVYPTCGLYIFGFTQNEKNILKKELDEKKSFYGHGCRIIGNTENDTVEKIYTALIRSLP